AEQRKHPGLPVIETRHAPEAKGIRAVEWPRRNEAAVAFDIEGPAQIPFERYRVVAHIIAQENREHHDVRLIRPYFLAQRHQFLRGAVAVHAEVQRLDAPALEQRTLHEHARGDRRESVLVRHLDGLGVGVADYRDADGAGRLAHRHFRAAEAGAVDRDPGRALASVVSGGVWPQAPSARRVVAIEIREEMIGDADAEFRDEARADH